MSESQKGLRIVYLDLLRIMAIIGVIVLHAVSSCWSKTDVHSLDWQVLNVFNSCVRWCVPVFIMISGALFLNKKHTIKKLFKKNIFRIITAFLSWSLIYGIISLLEGANIRSVIGQFVMGHYHMWFLFMIIGLYLAIPIIQKIVESEYIMKYFLILAFLFAFLVPLLQKVSLILNSDVGHAIQYVFDNMNLCVVTGYVGYFVLGFYLNKIKISLKMEEGIYLLGIIGFLSTIGLSSVFSVNTHKPVETFFDNFSINVLLESIGVFVLFRQRISKIQLNKKGNQVVTALSKYCFGVYLIHVLVFEQIEYWLGLNVMSLSPIVSVVLLVAVNAGISFSISWAVNHIPVLNKYIV